MSSMLVSSPSIFSLILPSQFSRFGEYLMSKQISAKVLVVSLSSLKLVVKSLLPDLTNVPGSELLLFLVVLTESVW